MPKFTFSFSWGLYLHPGGGVSRRGTGCSPKPLLPSPALLCQPGRARAGSHGQTTAQSRSWGSQHPKGLQSCRMGERQGEGMELTFEPAQSQ